MPAGHRLRVAVAGAAFPVAWPPPAPVALTVFHDADRPSRLRLPTPAAGRRRRRLSAAAAFDAGPPEARPGIPEAWHVERDELAGTTDARVRGRRRPPVPRARRPRVLGSEERYRVTAGDDWATAAAEGLVAYRVTWPGGPVVTADGRLRITSSAESFDVEISVDATEDGAPVHHRTWTERIPRDLV